ncbi:hypothetical protein [Amycolatopsis dongchuanensis]|uniref:DUF11 domain-containing protein n=1 Tax=Amycolatopsis dongchuanensis TaxID=1070866 RepID=A0ABP8VQ54_9PSEU
MRKRTVLAGLVAAGLVMASAPSAAADPAEVETSVSQASVLAGDTVTVTEKVTNVHDFSILHPTVRLFSTPDALTEYASLVDCSASCTTLPGGFQATLPEALDGFASATVTFTLRIAPGAPNLQETLQGQLSGSNYATPPIDGPALTVTAKADGAVGLTATPKLGLLVPRLEFTVSVRSLGPGPVQDAVVTTTLPSGLNASGCTPGAGTVACTFPDVPAGEARTATFSVPLSLLSLGLPYTFTARQTASASLDPVASNDFASTTCTVLTPLLVSCR